MPRHSIYIAANFHQVLWPVVLSSLQPKQYGFVLILQIHDDHVFEQGAFGKMCI